MTALVTGLSKDTERLHPFNDTIYKTRKAVPRSGTVAITAVADGPGGNVIITAPGHGYQKGDPITQAATTDYDGDFIVQLIDGDDYQIIETFVATRTGTTIYNTALSTLILYEGKARIPSKDADEEWQIRKNLYDAAGVLLGSNFPQIGGVESNLYKFIWDNRDTLSFGE